jgi:hypothetical protein
MGGAPHSPDPLMDNDGPFALALGVAPGWVRATIAVAALRPMVGSGGGVP